jgi:HPt (histidine-containing phosphotransfer) domain-containing protein
MDAPLTDLAYLERFCKSDRARMEKYIQMYLIGAPDLFEKMNSALAAQDGESLAVAAHSARPQVNYMGAQKLFDLLTALEQQARADGASACHALVKEAMDLNEKVMAELRGRSGHGG